VNADVDPVSGERFSAREDGLTNGPIITRRQTRFSRMESYPRLNYEQVRRVPPPLTRLLVKAFDGQIKSRLSFKDSAAGSSRQLARYFAADKSRLGIGNRNEIMPIDFYAPDARAYPRFGGGMRSGP